MMVETELKAAIESMHGGSATLAQSVPVRETFEGKTVWEGVVHVRYGVRPFNKVANLFNRLWRRLTASN
jgi:hypothetical protein